MEINTSHRQFSWWGRLTAASTTASLITLVYALLVIASNPSTGYELSIYSATPVIFWVAIIIGLANGIFLLAYSASHNKNSSKVWLLGAFEVIFCNIIVISLYALRGYVLYLGRGDAASYVGMAKDISIYGHVPDYNFYPVTSTMLSMISQLTFLSVVDISKFIPSLFFALYTFFFYCWAKSLVNDRSFVLTVFLASIPIFFAWFTTSVYHQLLSVMMLPLFFLCLQKNFDIRYRILCIILCVIYPFWHPITSVVLCMYLVIWFLAERHKRISFSNLRNVSLTLILICVTCLGAWFVNQYLLLRSVRSIMLQLFNLLQLPSTASQAEYYASKLGLLVAVKSLYLMINDDVTFYILSAISIYRLLKRDDLLKERFYPVLACFVIGTLLLIVMFFSTRMHTPDRLINLNFNMVFTPLMVGWLLYEVLLTKSKFSYILLAFLIFASVGTSVVSLYPSPLTMRPNDQVTYKEVQGMNWLISHKDLGVKTVDVLSPVRRYADLIFGYQIGQTRRDLSRDLILPDHFGMAETDSLPIDSKRYLVITDFDIRAYADLWKDIDRFDRDDFDRVDQCANVDKVYENSELRSYLVHQL